MSQTLTSFWQKPRYEILDGLRGVAALMVVAFHIFETHATSPSEQIINHGYLAVDFFFVLSGFVIGYAYDDRWAQGMTVGGFLKRRLIRLHPMVVLGTLFGALMFYYGGSILSGGASVFPNVDSTPLWKLLIFVVLGCLMIPVTPRVDIRGWTEIYPINGPQWSLFYEYIGNILYATVFRHFSKRALRIAVFLFACLLVGYAVVAPSGTMTGGWALTWSQVRLGLTRLLYPFFAGLLLYRSGRLIKIKRAFLWSSLLIIAIMALPRLGGTHFWINGLYEGLAIVMLFPIIVAMGAGGSIANKSAARLCKFLGDISFPIYITHYPLIYAYTAWVRGNNIPLSESWPYAVLLFFAAIGIAYASLKLYDLPVREWLKQHWLNGKQRANR